MITVLYSCNDSYIRQTIVSMVSVLRCHEQVKFYLVGSGLSQGSKDLVRSVLNEHAQKIRIFDIGQVLPKFLLLQRNQYPSGNNRHPGTIYAKLFMENVTEEERILYLDSDTVVNDSLMPLFTKDMEHELAAGVLMPYSSRMKKRISAEPGQPYICDGVVLFNMKLWRGMQKSRECEEYIKACGGEPPMLSEGVLNHVGNGMIGVLEPKYNLMPSMLMYTLPQIRKLFEADCYYKDDSLDAFHEAIKKPAVIHFMEELYNRPWREPCDHPWKESYRLIHEQVFADAHYEERDISARVRRTRKLYQCVPFAMFAWLYKIKNTVLNGVWKE